MLKTVALGMALVGIITNYVFAQNEFFEPAKPLGCYGDGGAIFTNNSKLAKKIRSIRVHGEGEAKRSARCDFAGRGG